MIKKNLFVNMLCLSVLMASSIVSGNEQAPLEAATEQVAAEHPAAEQPDAEQPAAEQPAAEQPDAEQPAAEQPAAEQPDAEQPAAEQPDAEQPDAEQPAVDLASMNWSDFTVSINGTVLTFPTTFDALAPLGLENDDDPSTTMIDPNQYCFLYFYLGKGRISVEFTNLDINVLPADQTVVTGIELEDMFLDDEPVQIELPGGIRYGESTVEDIENAYGKATDVYEGDMYTQLSYEQDIYNSVELNVDKETGKLNSIDIQNIKEPENMQKGEVSTEVPAEVAAYNLPDALSDDINAYQIQVEGTTYKLPVPVSVMIANGWTLIADNSDEAISAHSYGWVTLSKNNQTIHEIVQNHEDYATIPENCWLGSISLGLQDANLEGSLPGGIYVGMSKEECENILKNSGVEYETDDSSSSFLYYSYGESYDRTHNIIIFTEADSVYPENAVMTITVENNEVE